MENKPYYFAYEKRYRAENVVKTESASFAEWRRITGNDYNTPSARSVDTEDGEIEVMIPLVPARANDRDGYFAELESAGFAVERFVSMNISKSIQYSASIYVRKPK